MSNLYEDDLSLEIATRRQLFAHSNSCLMENIVEYQSLSEIEENLISSRFKIEYKGYHFECLFNESVSNNDFLYVIYNGARKKGIIPYFPRWTYHGILPGHMLCIEDPMYYKYPNLKLGWCYGNEKESLIQISTEIIKAVCRNKNINNIVFFSSSGGGYNGIYASTFFTGCTVIAINPQLDITNYSLTNNFIEQTGLQLSNEDMYLRNNISERINLYGRENNYIIIFNAESKNDMETQAIPFCEKKWYSSPLWNC